MDNHQEISLDTLFTVKMRCLGHRPGISEAECIRMLKEFRIRYPRFLAMNDSLMDLLRCAVNGNCFEISDFILSCGISIDNWSYSGSLTLLETLTWSFDTSTSVKYLLDRGADPESETSAFERLFRCFRHNNSRIFNVMNLHLLLDRRNYSVNDKIKRYSHENQFSVADILVGSFTSAGHKENQQHCFDILLFLVFRLDYRIETERMPPHVRVVLDKIYQVNQHMPDDVLRYVAKYMF